jgi:flagellar hook-associated protein 1 FlgK
MSISTFLGIQTSLRGLLAQQRSLDVTSHNIANANTAGYSRQEALLATTDAFPIAGQNAGFLGTGVDVTSYRRIRDDFLDAQYRGQSLSLGDQTARSDALSQVELSFAEPGDQGISARLNEFWDSWGNLSNAPSNPAARQSVIDKGVTLADAVNQLQASLAGARAQAGQEFTSLTGDTGEVHRLATDLANTLNAIRNAELTGAQPNDLYDHRDAILDNLWSLGQVSVTADPSATVTPGGRTVQAFDVSIAGIQIIDSDASGRATVMDSGTADNFPLTWPPVSPPTSGKLGALYDLASTTGPIGAFETKLDAFASNLASTVNGAYGGTFFTYNAATRQLSVATATVTATGDNTVAQQVAALRGGTADQMYAELVTSVGSEVSRTRNQQATAEILADNLKDRRESVAGVSLDEEMTNLIRFQRAYQASARTMSTTDELLDTLINRTGRVGL